MLSGKCKSKEDKMYTFYSGQNPGQWQHQMLVKIWTEQLSVLLSRQYGTDTLGDSLTVSSKTKHTLNIGFKGVYPKELKAYTHPKTCTGMFMAALFLFSQTWKQPRCPSAGERINKL